MSNGFVQTAERNPYEEVGEDVRRFEKMLHGC
jgi:hypothetical protein